MTSRTKRKIWFVSILWGGIFLFVSCMVAMLVLVEHEFFGPMPTFAELENPKSNIASEVYSEDHKLLGTYHIENRSFITFEDLSPNLIKAVVATEDVRYTSHSGIDMIGLMRVAVRTIAMGERNQGGGSTITQQLAKNLFPRNTNDYSGAIEKYSSLFVAKLKEWITAVRLERNYTKNEILAMYLNVIPFGSNAYGIYSASKTFFNKPPKMLNVQEAALLAGVINAPTRNNPIRNYDNAILRRNFVMRQMVRANFLSQESYDKLYALPIELKYQQQDHNSGIATYFRERVRQIMQARKPERARYVTEEDYTADMAEWERNPLYGWCHKNKKPGNVPYDLNRDGLKIYTTINSHMQQYAEDALVSHLKNSLQPALSQEVKNKGGRLLSNREEEDTYLLRAIKQTERYRVLRNAGMSMDKIMKNFRTPVKMTIFMWDKGEVEMTMTPLDSLKYYKAFVRASFMAMDPHNGYIKAYVGGPNFRYFKYDLVKQSKRQIGSTIKPFLYTLAMQEGLSPCHLAPNVPQTFVEGDSTWTPKNSGPTSRDGEMVTLRWGLANSVNNISGWVIKQFNPASVVTICHKMGITSYIPPVNSIFLGTAEVSLYEMVNAYATLANKGVRVMPQMVTRVEDRNGNVLTNFGATPKTEAISEQTAYLMVNILQSVVSQGTAMRLRFKYNLEGQIGGKTGTTQSQADGWFMGITPNLVAGAWVGCEDRAMHFESMSVGQGANSALPIFGLFLQKVYADPTLPIKPNLTFDVPLNMRNIDINCSNAQDDASKQNRKVKKDDFF